MTGNQPPTRAADLQAKPADGVPRTLVREVLRHLAVTARSLDPEPEA